MFEKDIAECTEMACHFCAFGYMAIQLSTFH